MKSILLMIGVFFLSQFWGQNPKGFEKMATSYINGTVDLIQPVECINQKVVFLDAREKEEFDISHIEGAYFVGFEDFEIMSIDSMPKSTKIVVYCSIGYRSEKIGEKLLKAGFTDVSNLYGGIFNWSNNGYPVYNESVQTKSVHGYSISWSKWLNSDIVTVITGKKK